MKIRKYVFTKQIKGQKEEYFYSNVCFNMFEMKDLFKKQITEGLTNTGNGVYTNEKNGEVWEFSDDEKIFKSDNTTFRLKTIRESEKWLNTVGFTPLNDDTK